MIVSAGFSIVVAAAAADLCAIDFGSILCNHSVAVSVSRATMDGSSL